MLNARDFLGHWQFDRQIDDRNGGQLGIVTGTADFTPENALVRYREAGQLRIGDGPVLSAERSYLWRFEKSVEVMFDDGRQFHSFVPMGRGQGTDHPCGEDFYQVTYDFRGWPEWTSTFQVSGPRKDYTSVTAYKRG